MSSPVEQIKERLSIYDVVSSYIKLQKAGRNYKARCPFHNEKTPSFFVSPERETYHCFGCDKGGDIFSFVEEVEGVDFSGALKILAERAGVTLSRRNPRETEKKERLFSVLEEAAKSYESYLQKRKDARTYLYSRGFTDESIAEFRIGFAPSEWRAQSEKFRARGFSDNDLETAGLVIRGRAGSIYDRFRSRIIFPITDASGRVAGFSGRIFGAEDERTAKYVNSPETPLFLKSRLIYGFREAKAEIRRHEEAILVEGQTDVILSHQSGVKHVVATSGTALTEHHLELLSRLAKRFVFAFDADTAGIAAAERGIALALEKGFSVSVIPMPRGEDPASLVKKGGDTWQKLARAPLHVIEFFLNTLKETSGDTLAFRKAVETKVFPYIALIQSKMEQAHFVARVGEAISVPEEPIWEAVRRLEKAGGARAYSGRGGFVITDKNDGKAHTAAGRRLLGLIMWQKNHPKPQFDVKKAEARFEEIAGASMGDSAEKLGRTSLEQALFEAEMYYTDRDDLEKELDELFMNVREHKAKKELRRAVAALEDAETQKDESRISELLQECQRLSKELNDITVSRSGKEDITTYEQYA